MAEVIIRLPSKVPYGYIEVRADASEVENLPSPDMLATFYATYFTAYKEAELKALQAGPSSAKSTAKPLPSLDETLGGLGTKVAKVAAEDGFEKAQELIVKELGGVPVEETGDEPWNQPTDPAVEAESKPWIAKAAESDWDFG